MANKPDWLTERSAVIPLIIDNDGVKVVLVTTKPKENNNWIFPKGQVELGMSVHDSAAKEAFEEAGVAGRVNPNMFDEYQHEKWGGKMHIKVFTMEVTKIYDTWMEMNDRNRQIVTLNQAIEMVQSAQKNTLIKLQRQLQN